MAYRRLKTSNLKSPTVCRGKPWRGIVVFFILAAVCGLSACESNSGDPVQPMPLNADARLGDVWAKHYPTTLAGYAADHTYVEAVDADGNQQIWKCFGSYTYGEVLENTATYGYADIDTVAFMASEPPCKWPADFYLNVGVCYQCTNRALYYTNKTVAAAAGYAIFALIYGTYGNEDCRGCGDYRMDDCLTAAPDWGGVVYRTGAGGTIDSSGPAFDEQRPAEIALYEAYRDRRQSLGADASPAPLFRAYLNDLLALIVSQRLDQDVAPETLRQLKHIQNDFLDRKAFLDDDEQVLQLSTEERAALYADLFVALADRFRAVLSPEDYEKIFDLPYDDPSAVATLLR